MFETAFVPTRNLSEILDLLDRYDSTLISNPRGVGKKGSRRDWNWDAMETDEGLHLRLDMPGLGKEDVKVSVEDNNTLIIKGEEPKEARLKGEAYKYSSRIELPGNKMFKTSEIKAEMKNGILKVVIPKVKDEDKKNVHHVNVD